MRESQPQRALDGRRRDELGWMIGYTASLDGVRDSDLVPFFVGWPNSPTPEMRLAALRGSYRVIVARDGERVVGFINAISDGAMSAFIPLLEVLPDYQHRGVGTELVRRMVVALRDMYIVDVVCDPELQPFYERLGMVPLAGMAIRNRDVLAAAATRVPGTSAS
jgi:ribosomal protein S18 acetylase RimI-like enzyme